jgi:molybdopterin/thiamine biosynthesis adenylyltransferase
MSRYDRQTRLPFVGQAGQDRLAAARVLIVGVGALGGVVADSLVRAGVGFVRLVDRDLVEPTNLQRQVLFDERSAAAAEPKAVAAADRLRAVNSSVTVEPVIADVDPSNVLALATGADLIFDGTDNAQTRYLINDVASKLNIPWIYGGCVGTDGRVMTVIPGVTPCLRCVFPDPPATGELPTCDTIGVLGPAVGVVASLQAAAGLKILTGHADAVAGGMLAIDFWADRFHRIDTGDRVPDCPCCGRRNFEFLTRPGAAGSAVLCGRDAVQVMSSHGGAVSLSSLADRLSSVGSVERSPYLVRCRTVDPAGIVLTVFGDGRTIVSGTTDPVRARSLVSRFVGG